MTINTHSIDTNHQQRDKDLSGPQFFDVAKFPEMQLVSTKAIRTGEQTFDVEGTLTLHGVTRPLVLHAVLNKSAPNPFSHVPALGITATATLKRSDFGMAAGTPLIGDTVSMESRASADAILNRNVLTMAAAGYLAGHDPMDPSASPLYGSLTNLRPFASMSAGTKSSSMIRAATLTV